MDTTKALLLWQNRDFLKLWSAQTISAIGSKITFLALPLTAVLALNATPAQMGYLTPPPARYRGCCSASFVGVVDRNQRRGPLVLAGHWARPVAVADSGRPGRAFCTWPCSMRFSYDRRAGYPSLALRYHAYLPSLMPRAQLVDANSKLELAAPPPKLPDPRWAAG
ncbi:MAG: hypothetical protein R2911_42120 [Caldilineaceae bacterium]